MAYLAIAGALFLAWVVLVLLFAPGIAYRVRGRLALDSLEFLHTVHSTCQASVHAHNNVTLFAVGARFYPAMLEAIGAASRSVTLECYIFRPGRVADAFIAALAERARAGVAVRIVLDAIGSSQLDRASLQRLEAAGCRVGWYRPLSWHSLTRINNRTHRELLIIDGRVAFVGGAGVADWWAAPRDGLPPWRDTMARLEGPIVSALQGVFMENWLEWCGEILIGEEYFPKLEAMAGRPAPGASGGARDTIAFVVKSSPSDRATASRVVFQLLIENASRAIQVATPYFLPDRALRRALIDAVGRGVAIMVLVPGRHTDQRWVRLASRRWYGHLLQGGLRIFEYQPSMIHVKAMVVDGLWSILGTTNIDNRSFEHNDEVNVAMRDPGIAATLLDQYRADLACSREITLEEWRRRPVWERVIGPFIWFLERQQ